MSRSMRCWYSQGSYRKSASCRSYGLLSIISVDVDRMFPKIETTPQAAVSRRDLATVGSRQCQLFCSALLQWLLVALLALLPRLQLLLHLLCRGRPERGVLGIVTVG
jgi:hypothetical protein